MTTARETATTALEEGGAVAGTARDEATNVASTAADAAKGVAQTATQSAGDVVGEAARQARDLATETRQQVRDQAESQTRRLAENARSLAGEISGMAARSEQQGPATELAHQLAGRVDSIAGYLEGATPEALVDDLRRLARRRPGLFLLGAGALGFAAGRLVKGGTSSGDGTTDQATAGGATSAFPGTATGQPTSGLEVPDAGGVTPGVTTLPGPGITDDLPVEPYPTGRARTDAPLGSADYRGAATGNG